jgi:hypothetical protein
LGKESLKEGEERAKKIYKLLSQTKKGGDITVRDDQYDFSCLLDAVKACRQRGFRFRLIDSNSFDVFQLEWLAEAGADIYTSDEARCSIFELELIKKACQRGGAVLAYFHHGPLDAEKKSDSASFSGMKEIGRCGIYLHITNRERTRDISQLNELADACRKGGSWLVYYHHGAFEPSLDDLGTSGVWVHVSDKSLPDAGMTQVLDRVSSALSSGIRLVIHLDQGLDFILLRDIIKAGAFVLFKSALFDYRSPFRALEREAKKRKVDFRAFYLYPDFLP